MVLAYTSGSGKITCPFFFSQDLVSTQTGQRLNAKAIHMSFLTYDQNFADGDGVVLIEARMCSPADQIKFCSKFLFENQIVHQMGHSITEIQTFFKLQILNFKNIMWGSYMTFLMVLPCFEL